MHKPDFVTQLRAAKLDHCCVVYSRAGEQSAFLEALYEAYADRVSRWLYVAAWQRPGEVLADYRRRQSPGNVQAANGALRVISFAAAAQEGFDNVLLRYAEEIDQLQRTEAAAGQGCLVIEWDVSGLSRRDGIEPLARAEHAVLNILRKKPKLMVFCQYDVRFSPPDYLRRAMICHPNLVYGQQLISLWAVGEHGEPGLVGPEKELEFWLGHLVERQGIENTLKFERDQLVSLFDGMDALVYVSDPETHEILYANPALQKAFGKTLVGGICYKEFQGREAPCEFCTNPIILRERHKPYRWEYFNPILKRHYAITDRIIRWPNGRDVRFELCVDITAVKQAELEVQRRLDYERVLSKISALSVEATRFDQFAEAALPVLGEGMRLACVCLYTLEPASGDFVCAYHWQTAVGAPSWEALEKLPVSVVEKLGFAKRRGEVIGTQLGELIGTVAPETAEHFSRPVLAAPITVDRKLEGIVTLMADNTKADWCEEEQKLLEAVAHIIAVTLKRCHVEETLKNQLKELQAWYKVTLGREERMLELRREVDELRRRLGEPPKYGTVF